MGVVYAARHVRLGGRVAVKLMPPHDAEAFLLEARVLAALTHPHVVTLYDYGVVEEPFFGVPAGAPWLAMELLTPWTGPGPVASWEDLRILLLSVLDALRAVHARGILHRDLKPSNLLRDATGRWKVADFGVARVGPDSPHRRVGTEGFGAPEQLGGRWWEVGPWSDVYAVGAIAAAVLEGEEPFPVPPGLPAWVARATAAAATGRFASALAAVRALESLGAPAPRSGPGPAPKTRAFDSDTFDDAAVDGPSGPAEPIAPPPAAPLPEVWPRATGPGGPGSHLGLGLLGLRTPPYVGRNRERALVWSALRAAAAGHRRHVHLAGPAGSGRWRLAQECAWAAAEEDAARIVLLDVGSVGAGLRQLLPLPPDRERGSRVLTARLGRPPDAPEVSALLAGLYGNAPLPASRACALVETVVRAFASTTPVVVALREGVEGAAELVDRLSDPDLAVLLLTTGSAAVPDGAEGVHLDPLPDRDVAALAGSLVPFDPVPDLGATWPGALLARLASAATAGGLLPTGDGFRWVPGPWDQARPPDADELHADELPAWVLATWLGPQVDEAHWSARCAALGVSPCRSRVDHWLRTGRLAPAERGFVAPAPVDALTDALPDALRARLLALVAEEATGATRIHAWIAAGQLDRVETEWLEVALGLPPGTTLLARVEEALQRAGRDRAAAEVQGWRAWTLVHGPDVAGGTALAEDLLATAERRGWDALVGSALHTLSTLRRTAGEALLERAITAYERGGDGAGAANARLHLAQYFRPRWGVAWLSSPQPFLPEHHRLLTRALCLTTCGQDAAAVAALPPLSDDDEPQLWAHTARVLVLAREWDAARRACAMARANLPDPSGPLGQMVRRLEATIALLSGDPRSAANHVALLRVGHPGTAANVAAWRRDPVAYDAALDQLRASQIELYLRKLTCWLLDGAAEAWAGHGDTGRSAAARTLRDSLWWEPTG